MQMRTILISLKIFLFFTVFTGIIYPLLVTGIAQAVFPAKANGSLVFRNKLAIGSSLIGQTFNSPAYFSSRPSATLYNPLPSGGSNFGLTNAKLKRYADSCQIKFIESNSLDVYHMIPSEMIFASGSGLDPHISPEAAWLQVDRIAKARNFNDRQKQQLARCVKELSEHPQFYILGENRINVLLLNLATDNIK
jgi:potassium-transporting ATPase KdpC subunit